MKELPILFSTLMVQAILEGRKTMTRRIIKEIETESKYLPEFKLSGFTFIEPDQFEKPNNEKIASIITCRYGQPGDVLWVRETWKKADFPEADGDYEFKASMQDPDSGWNKGIWKPSIHMPKAAARIWLMVEEINVQRLLEITEEDAIAEGAMMVTFTDGDIHPSIAFRFIWKLINGEESWDLNPWVWVVKFKVLSTTGKPQPETRNP